jgi:SAM-dependent methyltransferase
VDNVDETDHLRQVRKYYDHNTARFLKWGKGERTFNLHAALWPPEVKSLSAAMHCSDELVAREIERCPCPVERVLDLGCGVGGSVFYLARRLPLVRSFTGISLSPLQIGSARQRIPKALRSRIHFEEGSFLKLPADRFETDFSYAIEAFTHCPDPATFFAVQADLLPPGGRLAIVDDCLNDASHAQKPSARQMRLLDSYRRNWLLPGLRGLTALTSLAEERGFRRVKDLNLTPYLRLGRPRDRAISLLVKFLGPLMTRDAYLRSLVGGDARQKSYLAGLIHYRLLVFEKHAPNG